MKNILKIIMHDFTKISTNVVATVVIMGLCILPSLYAWFNINSNWDPYSEDATSNLKIAVISKDKGITVGDVNVVVGSSITDALKENKTIGWQFPKTEREAINGVYSGKYYAAMVIPEEFTESISKVVDGDTSGGKIIYYSNEKKNAIATKITDKAKNAVQNQVNEQVFSTLTQVIAKLGDAMKSGDDNNNVFVKLTSSLDNAANDVQRYIDILNAMQKAGDATKTTMETMTTLAPKMTADIQKDLSKLSAGVMALKDIQTATIRLEDYIALLEVSNDNVDDTIKLLKSLKKDILKVKKDLYGVQNSEEVQQIVNVLENEPEKVGQYFSALVDLKTVPIYPIKNYGSAMAAFYTVLAIWVGSLILVAIIKVKVEPFERLYNPKNYQLFFGRYFMFFVLGQIQTLICVLGDICFLNIQCLHPFLFWFAAAMSSFVFSLFMYALTFAFENVGQALAVVIMVVQVAGAGGTFPKEVLPDIYQNVYKFLPFPYCMNAIRECIGGMYKRDYWFYIGDLGIFIIISLAIGLFMKKPFAWLNRLIERSKEKSDIMF